MSNVTFSNALFEQMGGVNWQRRSELPSSQSLSAETEGGDNLTSVVNEKFDQASNRHAVVVLGAGLDDIWQNDTQQGWLLWQNIMTVFGWDEAQVAFFDTAHLVSEEMIFATVEEVIELGVDWVLTMDAEHELSEMLQEGVQVVSVPDIELMLMDPYAKQTFYTTVVSLPEQR